MRLFSRLGPVLVLLATTLGAVMLWQMSSWPDDRRDERSAVVVLTAVTGKSVYAHDERLALSLTLANRGRRSVVLSATTIGNVQLTVSRDGRTVEGAPSSAAWFEDPSTIRQSAVTALAPGANVAFPVSVSGTAVLTTVRIGNGGVGQVTSYDLTPPGRYSVRFRYRYSGGDDEKSPPTSDDIESNAVTFQRK